MSALEFAAPQSRYSWVSRARGLVFWGAYIVITASLMTIFTKMVWAPLGFVPLKTFHPWHWFKSDNAIVTALQYVVPSLIAIIFGDFFYYWFHRLQHASKFLWRFHSVHHSIREMSAWNCNHHSTEEIFKIPFLIVPMSIIVAVDPSPVLPVISTILAMHGLFIHSCTKLHFGPFRYVLSDNRFHRIHHSLEEHHWNKNFGGNSSIWDIIFRTAHMPKANEWPDTGLEGIEEPTKVRDFVLRPFRRVTASHRQQSAQR